MQKQQSYEMAPSADPDLTASSKKINNTFMGKPLDDNWEVITHRLSKIFKVTLLFRLVWLELALFLVAYYCINLAYRFALDDDEQRQMARLVEFFDDGLKGFSRDLTFLLGFYVSMVAKRWWDQYRLLPWPDNLALTLTGFVVPGREESLPFRQTLVRYALLSYVLCIRRFSSNLKRHLPTLQSIIDQGLVREDEAKKLVIVDFSEDNPEMLLTSNWWLPLAWSASLVKYSKLHNIVPSEGKELMSQILKFRHDLEAVESHVHVSIPLVYKLVVTSAIYVYFFLSLIGSQNIGLDNEVDLFFPVFTVFKLVLFIGWLKVARSIEEPFGDDQADFDMHALLTRHISTTRAILEEFDTAPFPYDTDFYPPKDDEENSKKDQPKVETQSPPTYGNFTIDPQFSRRSNKANSPSKSNASESVTIVDEYLSGKKSPES